MVDNCVGKQSSTGCPWTSQFLRSA